MPTVQPTAPTARIGLFGEQPLVVGDPATTWAVWITGTDQILPAPTLAAALIEASEQNAFFADIDDGSPFNPTLRAVVLHKGQAWRRTPAEKAAAPSTVVELAYNPVCVACEEPMDDGLGIFASAADALSHFALMGWRTDPDGRAICPATDVDHAKSLAPPAPAADQGPDLFNTAATEAADEQPAEPDTAPAPAAQEQQSAPEPVRARRPEPRTAANTTGYLPCASVRTNRIDVAELRQALADVPDFAQVWLGAYPLARIDYAPGDLTLDC
ncbi:hypothetical protein ACIA8O_38810 [Kitasatospora sp. NPDC051853]|uniref:hypothetical protein n=1 Tax=Kitasatospora sp. NPDC051853 TaxID=3364058 RepID=UPI0037A41EE5